MNSREEPAQYAAIFDTVLFLEPWLPVNTLEYSVQNPTVFSWHSQGMAVMCHNRVLKLK
jgi:hypothetical protein